MDAMWVIVLSVAGGLLLLVVIVGALRRVKRRLLARVEQAVAGARVLHREDWANLFSRLDAESDNLAAAMRWSLEHDQAEIALRVGGALRWWLLARPQFGQYAAWLERALQDCGEVAPRYRAKALFTIDLFRFFSFGYDEASAGLAEQCFAAAEESGDPNLIAQALLSLGGVASSLGQSERAINYYQQSLELKQACKMIV